MPKYITELNNYILKDINAIKDLSYNSTTAVLTVLRNDGTSTQIQLSAGGGGGVSGEYVLRAGDRMTGDLYVGDDIWLNAGAGEISARSGFFEDSDRNIKNIHGDIDLNKAYGLVQKCSAIIYDLKDDPEHEERIGVIAQEIEEFFPEMVITKADGVKTVNYAKLSVIVMRVLKDVIDRISKLEEKL